MLIFDYAKGFVTDDKIIVKSEIMPPASINYKGAIYIYSGESDETFIHGYIYECVNNPVYSALIGFEPSKIAFDYTKGNLIDFFKNISDDFLNVASGRIKYYENANIWNINGLDAEGNIVFENYQLYTEDIEDAGFVFIVPSEEIADEEEIEYYINYTQEDSFSWTQLNVQPSIYNKEGTATVNTPDGTNENAVVNVDYVNNTVGDIDTALNEIIEQGES